MKNGVKKDKEIIKKVSPLVQTYETVTHVDPGENYDTFAAQNEVEIQQ